MKTKKSFSVLMTFILFAAPLFSQDVAIRTREKESPEKDHSSTVQSYTELVVVPLSVTDVYGRPVTVLTEKNFKVYDNGKEQKKFRLSHEDQPITIAMVVDVSGSMKDKIQNAKEAVDELCKSFYLPQDEFMMVTVSNKPNPASGLTHSCKEAKSSLVYEEGKGYTSLVDGIYLALSFLKNKETANDRKVLIVISDGGDNHSRYTEGELKDKVKEEDVQIYAIGIFEPAIFYNAATPKQFPIEELHGPVLLGDITEASGGMMFAEPDPRKLKYVAEKIADILHNQYVLTYKPERLEKEKRGQSVWRNLKVKLKDIPRGLQGPLQPNARKGYYYVPLN